MIDIMVVASRGSRIRAEKKDVFFTTYRGGQFSQIGFSCDSFRVVLSNHLTGGK